MTDKALPEHPQYRLSGTRRMAIPLSYMRSPTGDKVHIRLPGTECTSLCRRIVNSPTIDAVEPPFSSLCQQCRKRLPLLRAGITCPKCGSNNVAPRESTMVKRGERYVPTKRYRCAEVGCKHRWQEKYSDSMYGGRERKGGTAK